MEQESVVATPSARSSTRGDRLRSLAALAPRVVPLAEQLAGSIRRIAIAGAIGAIAICLAIVWPVQEVAAWRWIVAAILAIVLLAPAAVLFVVDRALRDLRELPERLRDLPELTTAQQAELTRLAGEIREGRRLSFILAIRSVWSLARALRPYWDLVTSVVPSARMLLPPFSLLAGLSILACVVEFVLAVIVVLIVLLV